MEGNSVITKGMMPLKSYEKPCGINEDKQQLYTTVRVGTTGRDSKGRDI